ncbi:MAG TPA: hypothetical protein VLD61_00140 [Methylomirabilota bacterium]|nr:hypothetical protein [Methylomirabilota bacterium]
MAQRLLAILLVAALLASCTTSVQRVRLDDLPGGVRAGDRVRVTRTDGTAATFKVVAVTGDALRGSGGEIVPLHDMQGIEVMTHEVAQSTLKTVATVLAAAAFLGFWALMIWGSERGAVQGP